MASFGQVTGRRYIQELGEEHLQVFCHLFFKFNEKFGTWAYVSDYLDNPHEGIYAIDDFASGGAQIYVGINEIELGFTLNNNRNFDFVKKIIENSAQD